jgi:hypothetical protein
MKLGWGIGWAQEAVLWDIVSERFHVKRETAKESSNPGGPAALLESVMDCGHWLEAQPGAAT